MGANETDMQRNPVWLPTLEQSSKETKIELVVALQNPTPATVLPNAEVGIFKQVLILKEHAIAISTLPMK